MDRLIDRLERVRQQRRLSKSALARQSGVHLRLVQKLWAGERPRPSQKPSDAWRRRWA